MRKGAMNRKAVVETFPRELLEVADGRRCIALEELDRELLRRFLLADLQRDERDLIGVEQRGGEEADDEEETFHAVNGRACVVTGTSAAIAPGARASNWPLGDPRFR